MNYEVLEALGQIAQEKNVPRELVIETLEIGLLSAVKKRFSTSDNVDVHIDAASGEIEVHVTKEVVEDGTVEDPGLQIPLSAAVEVDPEAKVGQEVREPLKFADFGRNAIQTAKQILIQRVREAERERIYEDYQGRIGELVTGTVQQISHGDILVNLGRTEAVVPLKEQIRKERYRQGDPVRAYLVNVLRTSKGPQVVLSRTHPSLLVKLFQLEVPEIYEGIIEVKAVAREPGERAKIAVVSNDTRIDPVGACVGMKGSRVQAVVRELSNERIDIVPWIDDDAIFLSRALSPAVVKRVVVDRREKRMTAIVEDDQLSLGIGKSGQNARLAAQLTGWKIDIISETKFSEIQTEKAETFVSVGDMPGIGKVIKERLEAAGMSSARDVAESSLARVLEVPGIGEVKAEAMLVTAREIVSEKVTVYREELARIREAEEAQRAAEEEARRVAEEAEAAAAGEKEGEEQPAEGETGDEGEDGASAEGGDDASAEGGLADEEETSEEAGPSAEAETSDEDQTGDVRGSEDIAPAEEGETVEEGPGARERES